MTGGTLAKVPTAATSSEDLTCAPETHYTCPNVLVRCAAD